MESSLRKIFEIFEFFVMNMMKRRVCVYFRTTNEELMLSALVTFQITQIDENSSRTHRIRTVSRSCEYACDFQITRSTKTLLAHITFVRFLVRVNTHVRFQTTRLT